MVHHHGAPAAKDYWGYLIQPDKSPTPLFRSLLLGIAHYITKNVAPWEVKSITPIKLANFYRLCGGNCDGLFLGSPNSTLAFIYKSLGCYHSLQPSKDPFAAPSIPALTNDGFVKWQTVQLLLGPDEHVPFLQEAVKRFEIKNPYDGEPFPRSLPLEALPRRPDPEMCRWHEQVGQHLLMESEGSVGTPRNVGPAGHNRGLSDVDSLTDSYSSTDDSKSIVDATDYFVSSPRRPSSFGNFNATPVSPSATRKQYQSPPETVRRPSVPDQTRTPTQETAPQAIPFEHGPRPQNTYRQPSFETTSESSQPSESPRSPSPRRPRHPESRQSSYSGRAQSHSPHANRTRSYEQPTPPGQPLGPGKHPQRPQPLRHPSGELPGRRASAFVSPTNNQEYLPRNPADAARVNYTLSPQFYGPHPGSRPVSQAGPGMQPVPLQMGPPPQHGQPMPLRPVIQQGVPLKQGMPPLQPGMAPQQQPIYPRPQQLPAQMGPPPGAFARGQLRNTVHGTHPRSGEATGSRGSPPNVVPSTSNPPFSSIPPNAMALNGQKPPPPTSVPPNGMPPVSLVQSLPNNPTPPSANGPGVRFADDPAMSDPASRMRRRTMEEMARERERQESDMLEFEAGRRKARGSSGTRRSRSGDQR